MPPVVELLREQGIRDVLVTVGGTIPAEDILERKALGVAEVFTPGVTTQEIIGFVERAVRTRVSLRPRSIRRGPRRTATRRSEVRLALLREGFQPFLCTG